ncbi:hypothetical protein OAO91_08220 [Luminiphilus sp.]|nr:hypothetical protein [Luminiphilus sp.]
MKNNILLALSVILFSAVTAHAGHHEAEEKRTVIGMQRSMDGEFKPLYSGSASNMKIWQEWIQAHNDRDFDKIAALNNDEFTVYLPDGKSVVGSPAHRELLEGWIAEANTTWEIWWVIPNDTVNADGVMEEWLSTGNMLTMTDADGNVSREFHQVDMRITDGKLSAGYVSSMENIPAP